MSHMSLHSSHWRCSVRHTGSTKWRGAVLVRAQNGPPQSAGEVVSWAQQQFLQEVSRDKPDSSINLAKVCMLLALEEEAAGQLESEPSTSVRTSATASTWSLTRLDALAAQVVDTLTALEDTPSSKLHTPGRQADSTSSSSSSSSSRTKGSGATAGSKPGKSGSSTQASTGSAGNSRGASSSQEAGRNPQQQGVHNQATSGAAFAAVRHQAQRFPMQVLNAVNAVMFRRHGYAACNRFGGKLDSQLSVVLEDGPGSVAALTILYIEVCGRLGLQCGFKVVEEGRYCLLWPQPHASQQQRGSQELQQPQQPPQQQQQQGLSAPHEQEQPPSSTQQQQQQQQQTLLSVGGEPCVVDVYGEGALLPVREATELFELSAQDLFSGSSRRELLACLLKELQMSHWCTAVGCSPSPALVTPLNASTAVRQAVRHLNGSSIQRAAAAAAKCVVLLPQDPQAQLELALLSYFCGHYEDAWLELGSYMERLKAAAEHEQGPGETLGESPSGIANHDLDAAASNPGGGSSTPSSSSSSSSSSSTLPSSSNPTGSSTPNGSSSSNRVTELHAAIQSMLIGGAVSPELPAAAAAAGPTAAEAALVPADQDGLGDDDMVKQQQQLQEQELADILLLFHKLQLELMMAANREG